MQTPITAPALRQHFNYSWWKYLVFGIIVAFAVEMLYTVTAYHPPGNKVMQFYIATGTGDVDTIKEYLDDQQSRYYPDLEESEALVLTNDSYYKSMQLTTYLGAREGDVYLLDTENFRNLGAGEALVPLESYQIILDACAQVGLSADSGYLPFTDTGEIHLLGIPTDKLTGLNAMAVTTNGGYLTIAVGSENYEESARLIANLILDMCAR